MNIKYTQQNKPKIQNNRRVIGYTDIKYDTVNNI